MRKRKLLGYVVTVVSLAVLLTFATTGTQTAAPRVAHYLLPHFAETHGSSVNAANTFDTVLEVGYGSPTNVLACDNNSGCDGVSSALVLPVRGGQQYFIGVAGVNGARGPVSVVYLLLCPPAVLSSAGPTPQGAEHVQVSGYANMHFTLQASTDLVNWTALLSTNSPTAVFDYVDAGSTNLPRRFYRALVLP